jgi:ubiquinone/menaquinone biosynthesis C-methylase UbiE
MRGDDPAGGTRARSGSRLGPFADLVGVAQRTIRARIVPLDAVAAAVPRGGRVLEIGCGEGLVLERVLDRVDSAIGVDLDERKVRVARARLGESPKLRIELADAAAFLEAAPAGSFDTALLVDTLSSFPPPEQAPLLRRMLRVLRPGGTLVVKAIDTTPRWKAALSRTVSGLVYRTLRMSLSAGQRFSYLPASELAGVLAEAGATVEVRHLHRERHHPIAHVLVVARVPTASRPATGGSR